MNWIDWVVLIELVLLACALYCIGWYRGRNAGLARALEILKEKNT